MVVDTGVIISGFAFGGIPRSAIRKAFIEAEQWVSPQILKEYRDTPFELKAAGKISNDQMNALLSGIAAFVSNANIVIPRKKLFLCRDEEDNMLLECCFAADANYLITGDKDLLELDKTELKAKIPQLIILSPRTFLSK